MIAHSIMLVNKTVVGLTEQKVSSGAFASAVELP